MASTRSEAKLDTLEKMVLGFQDQLSRLQGEVLALTHAMGDITKLQGEVSILSTSVKGLFELKSLIEHMVQRQESTLDDSVLLDHQQGPPLDPPGLQQEHGVHPHKPDAVQPALCRIELPIFDGSDPMVWLGKIERYFEFHETFPHLQQVVESMENKDKEALLGKSIEKIVPADPIGADIVKRVEVMGLNLRKHRELWSCIWASDHRQTWAQRNPKSPPIKWVKKLTLVSLKKNGFNVVRSCIGPDGGQPRLANLLRFDGRESIGWILRAGRMGTTTTILPASPDLQIPLTESKAIDGGSGPALVTTKDAGDVVTLLQSLAGSTFDSSQLVLTACMGYHNVNETRLQDLRNKHRPVVKDVLEERSKGVRIWKDSQGLASKLYSFKQDPGSMMVGAGKPGQTDVQRNGGESCLDASSDNVNGLYMNLNGNEETDSVKDVQDQVVWLKVELCKLLEEKQSAELRAEELETALMEMVKQDNRRQLSARVEQLEQELSELQLAYDAKQEQENAMLQILMRVEQEQKVTEDARRFAEQDAAAQRYASQVLQEKYEEATGALAEMEKRAVMAESMLEATLQYQSGQTKAQPSPRSTQQDSSVILSNQDPSVEIQARKISLLSRPFGLGWRDRNKVKSASVEETNDGRTSNDGQSSSTEHEKMNDHPVEEK